MYIPQNWIWAIIFFGLALNRIVSAQQGLNAWSIANQPTPPSLNAGNTPLNTTLGGIWGLIRYVFNGGLALLFFCLAADQVLTGGKMFILISGILAQRFKFR